MNRHQEQESRSLIVFYSYADEDMVLCLELERHLSALEQEGIISGWHRHKMPLGARKSVTSNDYLSSAHVILLLISPRFLASDFTLNEMQRAIQRHNTDKTLVIPLLLRPSDWKHPLIADLQVLPRDEKAVTAWGSTDLAFEHIVKEIRLEIKRTFGSGVQSSSVPTRDTLALPPLPSVFLSYAPEEHSFVNRLKNDLQARGITDWGDRTTLRSDGSDKKEDLHIAIHHASAVVLVVSAQTGRSRLAQEEIFIAQRMYQRPIYLFWMDGDLLAEVIPPSCKDLPTFDARGERYNEALQKLMQIPDQLSLSPSQDLHREETTPSPIHAPVPVPASHCPYKGLNAFKREDVGEFFGRDRLNDELLEQVKQGLTASANNENEVAGRLIAVLGPSGSGKSSLVMAGLVPRLQQGALPGSQDWVYLHVIVPDRHPLEALARALRPLFPLLSPGTGRLLNDLQSHEARGLHMLLEEAGKRVILVIDQFEKLLIQVAREKEQQQFLDLMLTAITEPYSTLFVILTLRADFCDDHFQRYPTLGHLVKKPPITVDSLSGSELCAVIEEPARRLEVPVTFEGDLVSTLIMDIGGQVGALPLLQLTLTHLFQECEEQKLTLSDYENIGGIRGVLMQHAKEVDQFLSSQNQQLGPDLVHALFSRLIDPGTQETGPTKCRVPLSAFKLVDLAKRQKLTEAIEIFTNRRLLTINTSTVELSHEALIDAWELLKNWLPGAQDKIRLQQVISAHAIEWKQHGNSPDRLYRGAQLEEALRWRKTNLPNVDEAAFLQASVEEQRRIQALEEEQQQYHTRRTLFIAVATLVVGGAGGVGGTGILVNLHHPSSTSQSSSQPKIPYVYRGHTGSVYNVAWSPDSKHIASASADKTVLVWDASSGNLLLTYTGHTDIVNSVAWSPDGKRIASASADKTVLVWDTSSGTTLRSHTRHTSYVESVAWSPDGKRIASASADKTVLVWDTSSGNLLLTYTGHTNIVNSVTWSPDSKRIASAGYSDTYNTKTPVPPAQVWDAGSGSFLFFYTGHTDIVNSVAWSPDGKRIASASADKTVQVWDASSGTTLLSYTGHIDIVNSVAWSPDGQRIVSASADQTVQVWNASSRKLLFSYTGHTDGVNSTAWSRDGMRIASASTDHTVQVWWIA